jgi:hypothetical protein
VSPLASIIIAVIVFCLFAKEIGIGVGVVVTLIFTTLRVWPVLFVGYCLIEYISNKV